MPNFGNNSEREKVRERKRERESQICQKGEQEGILSPEGHPSDRWYRAPPCSFISQLRWPSPWLHQGPSQPRFLLTRIWNHWARSRKVWAFQASCFRVCLLGEAQAACHSFTWPCSESTPTPTLTERKCNPCVWDRGLLICHSVSLPRRVELASLCIPWDSGSWGPALHS